jgi:hypothetical protein
MFQFNLTLLPSNSVEAVRKIIEAVRLFVEAVRLLVEAGRVLRSSANKSIPIDPRLRNSFLHS